MFYQSMNHIVLYTVALVVILVWIGARRNPIMALVEIGKEMLRSLQVFATDGRHVWCTGLE